MIPELKKMSSGKDKLNIKIEATLDSVDFICLKIARLLTENRLDNLIFEISLTAREALVNAVKHGNKTDHRLKIKFLMCIREKEIAMAVEDNGNGFNYHDLLNKKPDLSSENGRGLLIMKKYATELRYNKKANKVLIKKKIK